MIIELAIAVGVVMVTIMLFAIRSDRESTRRRTSTLASLANALGYPHEVGDNFVTAKRDGVKVKLAYETRGSGSTSQAWTEVSVDIPASYPLTLYVRRHSLLDGTKIATGKMVDVLVGDQAFDDAYLVEAAPTDVVRELIDHRARAYLMGASHMELVTERRGDTATLKLSIRRWEEDFPAAQILVDEAIRLARRVRDVYAKIASPPPAVVEGSPFRPHQRAVAADEANAREHEVERVRVLQPKRAQADMDLAMVILGVSVVGCLVVAALWLVQKVS